MRNLPCYLLCACKTVASVFRIGHIRKPNLQLVSTSTVVSSKQGVLNVPALGDMEACLPV